ncbi:terminase large subunit [Acidovorax sp. Leaf160]|uniref:terminase large subunit n=1 Tax=Acidovorax sp. Leaf160 TaxID=1736280 RepID=UPI0006F42534|nr:terminase large subunit [Acidovorax sp. Leaf160]KQR62649.1 terminase [Acidovorax sp. Leaf160]
MPEWTTACPDWADRLRAGRSIIPAPIFPDEAEAGLSVMRELRIVDAPGSPRIGDASGQWVFDLAASIFGAYDAESGRRLITEWFVMLPKKNFKSGLAASIMLTMLIRNWRKSAEFTILAPTLEVAHNSFGPAKDMVTYEEDGDDGELADLVHVQTHIKTLTHREMNATLKVIAADANTAAGKKSVGVLVEELWLFGKQANAKDMLREATGGLASRPEGFTIYITTQSDEPPQGVFKEKLEYARDVRDGKIIDPQFVPILFEHPPELVRSGEARLLENLPMVNPNLGYSVDRAYLEREFRKAEAEGEASLKGFLAKYGNVEVGLNLRSDRWLGADFWEAAAVPVFTLEELLERCEVATIGIDGGGLDDMLGLAVVGREIGTGRWLVWTRAWLHPIALERRKSEESRYRDFAKQGDLVLAAQVGKDIADVVGIVSQVVESGLLDKVGVDRAGLGGIYDALVGTDDKAGPVKADEVVGIPQGWQLQGAIKTAERHLAAKRMVHSGQPLMAWCVGNAKVVAVGNAISITKQASGFAKIDPLMALFDAVYLMALNPEAKGGLDDWLSNPIRTGRA